MCGALVPPAAGAVVAGGVVFALPAEDAWGEFVAMSLPPPPHAAKPIANKH